MSVGFDQQIIREQWCGSWGRLDACPFRIRLVTVVQVMDEHRKEVHPAERVNCHYWADKYHAPVPVTTPRRLAHERWAALRHGLTT